MIRIKWLLLAIVSIFVYMSSCGVQINVSGSLATSPEVLEYGIIPLNKASTISVEVSNKGSKPIYLTKVNIVYTYEDPVTNELLITEGAIVSEIELIDDNKHNIDVTFVPEKEHDITANVIIEFRRGSSLIEKILPVTGTGFRAMIEISPSYYNFKHSYLFEEKTRTFNVRSIVNKAITVESVELVDYGTETAMGEIFISSGWDGNPKILQFSQSFDIEVTFYPQIKTIKTAKLKVSVRHSLIDYIVEIDGWGCDPIELITQSPLPEGVMGSSYNVQLEATGGDGNYEFAVESGTFPLGLGLSETGEISGIPSNHGEYSFNVVLTDSSGNTTNRNYTLNVTYASLVRDSDDVDPDYIFAENDYEGLFSVNLINVGIQALTITNITISGTGVTSGETTILNQPTLPAVIQPSETTNITLKVESLLDEGRVARLTVAHTGYNSPFIGNFDWSVEGDKHIFIIDASGSMLVDHNVSYPVYNQDGNIILDPTRWEVAVYDISEVLRALDKADKFEVIVFEGNLHYFFGSMEYANGSNRYDSISWLFNFPVAGCSNMYDAMYNGFNNYGTLEEMYVYSDGGANTAFLLGCGGCACGGWIGSRTYTDCQTWVPDMVAENPDFHLYMLQYAASSTGWMRQIGDLSNCSYTLK